MRIENYSSYDTYTFTSETENVSNIVDKLIRISAKITERFAGDIYYDIKSLYRCVEEHEPYDRVLFFRESGVWTVNVDELCDMIDHIQAWRLTHNPESMVTTLIRVDVRKDNLYER
jgi:hypothetical protein